MSGLAVEFCETMRFPPVSTAATEGPYNLSYDRTSNDVPSLYDPGLSGHPIDNSCPSTFQGRFDQYPGSPQQQSYYTNTQLSAQPPLSYQSAFIYDNSPASVQAQKNAPECSDSGGGYWQPLLPGTFGYGNQGHTFRQLATSPAQPIPPQQPPSPAWHQEKDVNNAYNNSLEHPHAFALSYPCYCSQCSSRDLSQQYYPGDFYSPPNMNSVSRQNQNVGSYYNNGMEQHVEEPQRARGEQGGYLLGTYERERYNNIPGLNQGGLLLANPHQPLFSPLSTHSVSLARPGDRSRLADFQATSQRLGQYVGARGSSSNTLY